LLKQPWALHLTGAHDAATREEYCQSTRSSDAEFQLAKHLFDHAIP